VVHTQHGREAILVVHTQHGREATLVYMPYTTLCTPWYTHHGVYHLIHPGYTCIYTTVRLCTMYCTRCQQCTAARPWAQPGRNPWV